MKKTYINPATEIVFVAVGRQICTGSPNQDKPTNLDGVTQTSNDPGSFSRRRRSEWDDEEEEW